MKLGGFLLRRASGTMLVAWLLVGGAPSEGALQSELVISGLTRPVQVTAPPGDFDRIFVVEQWSGQVLSDL